MTEQVAIDYDKLVSDVSPLQNVICGEQIEEFLNFKKISSQNPSGLNSKAIFNLRNSSVHILSYCNPHNATNNIQTTHLVVGYVQSGKTMSFTAVSKLALDNHYRIIIYLTGVTSNLLDQTSTRLEDDLICNNDENYRKFKFYVNPTKDDIDDLSSSLLIDGTILIIPILKHYGHINTLASILSDKKIHKILENETAIIVDDEADQASLNTNGSVNTDSTKEEVLRSKTYSAILNLRSVLPGNSYIQYTATPQANILIDTIDALSPKTHTLLEPGDGYEGGKQFFGMDVDGKLYNGGLIEVIPDDEVLDKKNNTLNYMPQSLKKALIQHIWATYIVVYCLKRELFLSMMVHVDVTEFWNRIFYNWIKETLNDWLTILSRENTNLEKQILISLFKEEYYEAIKYYSSSEELPNFETALEAVPTVISDRKVYLVIGNSKESHEIKWKNHALNILVGANMLNRGFTINNLATTYMPRFPKDPNADTIEQRCRFFGYKSKYINSCRVFLPMVSISAYKDYVRSEEELRNTLRHTKSLSEFGHKIMLSPKLNPTRKNVLPNRIVRSNLRGSHEFQSLNNYSIINSNKTLIESFIIKHKSEAKPFIGKLYNYDKYEGQRKHECFSVSLKEAEEFLRAYQSCDYADNSLKGSTIRYLYYISMEVKPLIENILIVNMGCGSIKTRTYNKTTHKITSHLYTGPDQNGPYPGDLAIKSDKTITIQLHHINFTNMIGDAYAIQIFYPESLSTSFCSTK